MTETGSVMILVLLGGFVFLGWYIHKNNTEKRERYTTLRTKAYESGFGEEFDLEVCRLQELIQLNPTPEARYMDVHAKAYETALLQHRIHEKRKNG